MSLAGKCVFGLILFSALARQGQAVSFKTIAALHAGDDGQYPQQPLANIGGTFYGAAPQGGRYFLGTLFKFDSATGKTTTLYSFTGGKDGQAPSGLVNVGGVLYGTAGMGGQSSNGTLFKFDPASNTFTVLYQFAGGNDGSFPLAGLLNAGGTLYGTTYRGGAYLLGTVFKFDPSSNTETVLHGFGNGTDGAFPYAPLVKSGTKLYGTTSQGGSGGQDGGNGTVFSIDPTSGAEQVLYNFTETDGSYPYAGLVAAGNKLYGTTLSGGAQQYGTVFVVDRATGAETTLYNFPGGVEGGFPYAGLVFSGNLLFGTTSYSAPPDGGGTLFCVDPATGAEKTLHKFSNYSGPRRDGYAPFASLVNVGGALYGSTAYGGVANDGTLFGYDPATDKLTTLHGFTGDSAGQYFNPGVIGSGGALYLATPQGGTANLGAVLKIDPASGAITTLHSFTGGGDGFAPSASLLDYHGKLFGTTFGADPASGSGTVFRVNPATGETRTLHKFTDGSDGGNPLAGLVNDGGELWGTTAGGYIGSGQGTVFKINPVSGAESSIAYFEGEGQPQTPAAKLTRLGDYLYGTSVYGGADGTGTIYQVDPASGAISIVYNFTGGSGGSYPYAALTAVQGALYGVASRGGDTDNGVVFKFEPKSGKQTPVYAFSGGGDGSLPFGTLLYSNGNLYGTASQGGANSEGTVYAIDPNTGALTTLHSFTLGADGGVPQAGVLGVGDKLYGTTSAGGAGNRGTVFWLRP
jgi:uncharacterized repeat protein (TIGR03803 family)